MECLLTNVKIWETFARSAFPICQYLIRRLSYPSSFDFGSLFSILFFYLSRLKFLSSLAQLRSTQDILVNTVNSFSTDTSLNRTLEAVPGIRQNLTLLKADTSLRWTLGVGAEGLRLCQKIDCIC